MKVYSRRKLKRTVKHLQQKYSKSIGSCYSSGNKGKDETNVRERKSVIIYVITIYYRIGQRSGYWDYYFVFSLCRSRNFILGRFLEYFVYRGSLRNSIISNTNYFLSSIYLCKLVPLKLYQSTHRTSHTSCIMLDILIRHWIKRPQFVSYFSMTLHCLPQKCNILLLTSYQSLILPGLYQKNIWMPMITIEETTPSSSLQIIKNLSQSFPTSNDNWICNV